MRARANWQNRIVKYAEVNPESLLANDDNWRTHPMFQREIVESSLDNIGWIQDVIVNRRSSDEWGEEDRNIDVVVDGHLRVLLALQNNQESIPVKYVDLSPEEEKLVLLTLDPSSTYAAADEERLKYLLESVDPIDEATVAMLSDLAEKHKIEFSSEEADDPFADFGDQDVAAKQAFVKFQFGDYSGHVSQSVYERFVNEYEERKNQTGEVMLSDVIEAWFRIESRENGEKAE
jgi:hypothetical protein